LELASEVVAEVTTTSADGQNAGQIDCSESKLTARPDHQVGLSSAQRSPKNLLHLLLHQPL